LEKNSINLPDWAGEIIVPPILSLNHLLQKLQLYAVIFCEGIETAFGLLTGGTEFPVTIVTVNIQKSLTYQYWLTSSERLNCTISLSPSSFL
jgi:hypothetical protein